MNIYQDAITKTRAFKTIYTDFKSGRLNHTYLLLTEDMNYALQEAKMIASVIFNASEKEKTRVKIQNEVHPDVIILGKIERIMTEAASELSSSVFVRPYEEDKKVYILLNMQNANDEAQNKLLKTIEEPPEHVYFILCASGEQKLLKTVLSRSKKIELDLFDSETIFDMLLKSGVSEEVAKISAACSSGLFERALKMATDKEFLMLYDKVFECLEKMNSSREVVSYVSLFSGKGINREELGELFMLISRDAMMIKLGKVELIHNHHKVDSLKKIAEGFSVPALYRVIECSLQFKEDISISTLPISAIDEFLLKIVEAKVRCKQ